MEKVVLKVKNHTFRGKGDFIISEIGIMSPKTRNSSIWGSVDANFLPDVIFEDEHFVVPTEGRRMQDNRPITLSAFFKFSKSNFNVFAEYFGVKLASHFKTKTSYNCPALLDENEGSISEALKEIPESKNNTQGSLVLSMLGPNDKLFSFSYIMGKQEPISDVRFMFKGIDTFVLKYAKNSEQRALLSKQLKQEFAYQYLFRDCFADVDFTSKNSGMIFNESTGKISLAPQFDFGELLNILYKTKFCEPKLDSIENYPQNIRYPGLQDFIERMNQKHIENHNAPAGEVAKQDTFGDESLKNISSICEKFPEVVVDFLTDLQNLSSQTNLPELVKMCAVQNNEELISGEQQNDVCAFAMERMNFYSQRLQEGLQNYAPRDFMALQQKSTGQEEPPVQ